MSTQEAEKLRLCDVNITVQKLQSYNVNLIYL